MKTGPTVFMESYNNPKLPTVAKPLPLILAQQLYLYFRNNSIREWIVATESQA